VKANDIGNDCLAAVDCTDCPYKTHFLLDRKPDKKFYTYKSKKSGLRYEVATSIRSDDIVWISGPHLPGVLNDIAIFRTGLKFMLEEGERIEADDGYVGECPRHVKVRKNHITVNDNQVRMRGRIGWRYETTVNRRLKAFHSLNSTFKHSVV
jgi:hypothetical protein